ncbi:beta-lactamase family protein [Thioalkalivibrio sp. XN8]|nr:beta-lactamase family protein [Thioalkalivibrio sp. XN8]
MALMQQRDAGKLRLDHPVAQQTLYPAAPHFRYSNLGLSLAGEIVVATCGQTFDAYMREHLLDPLGMSDTSTDIPVELRVGRMAIGHTALKRDGQRAGTNWCAPPPCARCSACTGSIPTGRRPGPWVSASGVKGSARSRVTAAVVPATSPGSGSSREPGAALSC